MSWPEGCADGPADGWASSTPSSSVPWPAIRVRWSPAGPARHDLTDQLPVSLEVAVPRGRRALRTCAAVRWHHFASATFQLGREQLAVADGIHVGCYSAERSIVDVYRLPHLEGLELAREALRAWLRRPGAQPAAPLELAAAFPAAEAQLRADLEVLL